MNDKTKGGSERIGESGVGDMQGSSALLYGEAYLILE